MRRQEGDEQQGGGEEERVEAPLEACLVAKATEQGEQREGGESDCQEGVDGGIEPNEGPRPSVDGWWGLWGG